MMQIRVTKRTNENCILAFMFVITIISCQLIHSTTLAFMSTPLLSTNCHPHHYHHSFYASTTDSEVIQPSAPSSLFLHHTAIKTRNIETAIKFYSLFGYEIEHKFRAGPARAAWLTNAYFSTSTTSASSSFSPPSKEEGSTNNIKGQNNVASRIELIEVPSYMLNEKENTIKRSIDLIKNESLLGLNHYALDVTSFVKYLQNENETSKDSSSTTLPSSSYGLDEFLEHVETLSMNKFNKKLRIAVPPRQQVIGNQVYELAFLYDADGTVVELVRYIKEIKLKAGQSMDSGWEPWDGSNFVGRTNREEE